ncbi:MAG TPA: ABC transporter permease subunit [Tepidisphaeraceae bacterium]|nr:ABC transporter permease subunit [Tepidisphaeraceae bacterium]
MPIYDQGYQHWNGQLSGHGWRWLAITRHGVLASMKSRLLRIVLMSSWAPALALAAFLCMWGLLERGNSAVRTIMQFLVYMNPGMAADPRHYRVAIWTLAYHFFLGTELYFCMALILLVGPNLISQDLRFNALPLYFSRPLRRMDYFLGKLGVIVAFLVFIVIGPSIAAYILGLLFSLDITILRDTFGLLLAAIGYGVVLALSAGSLMLALSTRSRNSRYVMLMWVAIWLISGITTDILQFANTQQRRQAYFNQVMAADNLPTHPTTEMSRDYYRRRRAAREQAMDEFRMAELAASTRDWRGVVSYVGDLSRIERSMIGSDDAWRVLSMLDPPAERPHFLANALGTQFPWYWSAAVLAALAGLSAATLHFSIRSLDRLR